MFVQVNAYIALRLTGELSLDEQHASLLGLRDVATGEWSQELCDAVGVTASQFPAVSAAQTVIGMVTSVAAAETGLPVGVPVVAGTVDGAAAALEAGVVARGEAVEMTGTSTVISMPDDVPGRDERFITMASCLPNQWLTLAAVVASGASLRWLGDVAAPGTELTALTAEAAALGINGSGIVFLPYMMGERSPLWNADARGVFLGLTLSTSRAELVRAVLEGTAFAVRHNLDVAASTGLNVGELRCTGGPSLDDMWCQIHADVTQRPLVRMKTSSGATFGGAALALVAAGLHDDIRSLVLSAASVDKTFEPRTAAAGRYEELYSSYRRVSELLADEFGSLARVGSHGT